MVILGNVILGTVVLGMVVLGMVGVPILRMSQLVPEEFAKPFKFFLSVCLTVRRLF
jgi:hypothetical protein